jgi:hypothetical protein
VCGTAFVDFVISMLSAGTARFTRRFGISRVMRWKSPAGS